MSNENSDNNGSGFDYMIKEVGLYSRLISKRNTTHDNLVDMSIEKITLWKKDKKKRICELILYFISFGIVFILEYFFPKLSLKLRCYPAYIDDADYVEIINKRGKSKLIKLYAEFFGNKEIEMQNLDIKDNTKDDENENDLINNDDKEEEENEDVEDSMYKKINKKEKKDEVMYDIDIDYERKRLLEEDEKFDVENNRYLIQKKHLKCDKYFFYLNNKYQYEENECLFVPNTFFINRYTIEEIIKMKNGIPNSSIISKLSNKYGPNKIQIKNQGIIKSILKEASNIYNIYVLFCIIIWLFMGYYFSIIIVLIISIIQIIISTKNKLDNIHSLSGEENKKSIVIRQGQEVQIESENIIPGDIVILKPDENNGDIYIPCDGIILEGFCTVNESDLTGENTLVLKKEININASNKNEFFDYLKYKNSFLFQGTIIDSLYSTKNKEEIIKMMATDIGFSTYRGNMLKNWEEQNFNFVRKFYDFIVLVVFILIIILINLFIYIFLFLKELPREDSSNYEILKYKIYNKTFSYNDDLNSLSKGKKFLGILNNMTLIFPPTLLLCINFGRAFYNSRLKRRNISCVIEKKIDSTGNIDIIVLDKTGTLTESQLEMNCYKLSSLSKNNELIIDDEVITSKIMNKIYKKFWQNIYKKKLKSELNKENFDTSYQTSFLYNIIYFTECLATCHNIFCFNQKIFGNSVDKELFQELGWEIFQENDDLKNPMFIQPHNAYKITENSILDLNNNNNNNIDNNSEINSNIDNNMNSFINIDDINLNDNNENINNNKYEEINTKEKEKDDNNININNKDNNIGNDKNFDFNKFFKKSIQKHLNKDNNNIINTNDINTNNSRNKSRNKKKIKSKNNTLSNTHMNKTLISIESNNQKKGKANINNTFQKLSPSKKILKKKLNIKKETNFFLKYLHRSEFASRFQSMSVIVQNSLDNSIRLYVKGAPEKIKKDCDEETLPINLDKQLQNFTSKGFRVLACATKLLSEYNPETDTREKIENEMTFLGLIVFQNQVKKDTKIIIDHLESSGCKLVIATGDNVFTTISIAEQCGILKSEDDLFRIETVDNNDTALIIIHSSFQKMNLDKIKNKNKKKEIKNNEKNMSENDLIIEEANDDVIYSIKEEEYPLEFKLLIKNIVNDPNKKICFSGPALSIILNRIDNKSNLNDNYPEMDEYLLNLEKLIKNNGKIFFRMLPDNKSNLIAFLQNDQYSVVAMCGDGANDSNAFMQSDVGVAINQTVGNNLISHFYSTESSISCLEIILKNGRACYESKINTFKFIITSSMLETSIVFILYSFHQQFNISQFVFIDIILKLLPCLLITGTETNYTLSNKKPPKKVINLNFILSAFGLYIIQFGGALIFICIITKKFSIDETLDLLPIKNLTIKSSYTFIFLCLQDIFLLTIINSFSFNRLPFYTNKIYIIYISIIIMFIVRIITVVDTKTLGISLYKFASNWNQFRNNNEFVKIFIIVINIVMHILSFLWNMLINKFCDWSTDGIKIKKE